MLPRSLAGRSLGRISALKGNAPARAYFVQAQHPRLPEDKTPSSSFPRRSSSSSPSSTPPPTLASIPSPGTRPGQPPPAYPSKDKVLIILDHGTWLPSSLSLPFSFASSSPNPSPFPTLPLAFARLLRKGKLIAISAIKSSTRVRSTLWKSHLLYKDVLP